MERLNMSNPQKISQLENLNNINDDTKVIINKYLNNGRYQLNLIKCSNIADQINSSSKSEYYITISEIEEQNKIINKISTDLVNLSRNLQINNNYIQFISSELSNTMLSDDNSAKIVYSQLSDIENNVFNDIRIFEESLISVENGSDIFMTFNEMFKIIDFQNINEVLSLSGEIDNSISVLSIDYNKCSSDISNNLSDIEFNILDDKIKKLESNNQELNSKISNINTILSYNSVVTISSEIINGKSIKIETDIEEHMLIDRSRIIANIYQLNENNLFFIEKINEENIKIEQIDTKISIEINVQFDNINNYILVVTFFKKPNILNY